MHILEQYALSCGLKIGKPHIETLFYPTGVDKYITIHNSAKFESRNYDYFGDAVSSMLPFLKEEGISIFQVGMKDDPLVPYCKDLRGKTNLKQLAYVLSKSSLHIGIDSLPIHLASHFKVPIVGLYSNMYKQHSAPYWRDDSTTVLLESDRKGLKPSYSNNESPKTINMICPDDIASEGLNLLNINHNLNDLDCFYVGSNFGKVSIDVIPNFLPNAHFSGSELRVRMDKHHSSNNLASWLSYCKCDIIAKEQIDLATIFPFKNNIKKIIFIISGQQVKIPIDYLKILQTAGIPFELKTEDEDLISSYRMHYFDWQVLSLEKYSKKCVDKPEKICDTTLFKTSRVIFSNQNKYASEAHQKEEIPMPAADSRGLNGGIEILNQDLFWEWAPHYKLFNIK